MSDDEQGGFEADDVGKKKQLASTLWGEDGDDEDEEDFVQPTSTTRRASASLESGAENDTAFGNATSGGNDQSRSSQKEDRESQVAHLRMLQERRERARMREQTDGNTDTSYAREINLELEDGPRPPSDSKAYLLKPSSQFGFNPEPFDPNTFDWAQDKPKGVASDPSERPRTENIMRWRWLRNQFGEYVMQSNTHLVQWSDGSFSFFVGKTPIPAIAEAVSGEHQLFTRHKNNVLRSEKQFSERLTLVPPPSARARASVASTAKAKNAPSKTRIVNDDIDPVLARKQAEEVEYQKARIAAKFREAEMKKRKATPSTLSVAFLEDDEGEDDDEQALQAELNAEQRILAAKQGLPKAKRRKTFDEDEDVDMSDSQ